MQSQQKADSDLLRIFGRMVTITVLLLMLAFIGVKYFSAVPQMAARNMEIEHTRLLNVLTMVRSQWLSLGKPQQMALDWEQFAEPSVEAPSLVPFNRLGWPQPKSMDSEGCQLLWLQLMGGETKNGAPIAEYYSNENSCVFRVESNDEISYQLDTGRAIFLKHSLNSVN
ncbi:MSHA biogenesis protein MshF [Shewanella sp. A25]|nr:MSHA biogenesis protein MshF [Shewanella shenzhenensis]